MTGRYRDIPKLFALAASLALAGCSTAPMLDVLDYVSPGRIEKGKLPPHGGVCTPGQGTIPICPPPITNLPTTPPVVVPPAIPGPAPSPSPFVPSQPPTIPPPPPPPTIR